MRITGWRVDGYGVLADALVEDLPPGLTVVCGPNEAGKSTLLAFVRHVLFGFPDRRRREDQHEPLAGGRHGGALFLADEGGRRFVLERHAPGKQAVLVSADGTPIDDDELGGLLGGADATLFGSVFAFGLDELASLASLEADEVRDRVFSAGVLGAGRSANAAVRALAQRQDELARPRKTDARANALAARAAELDRRLRAARDDAARYPELAAQRARLDAEVAAARAAAEQLRRRVGELDLLTSAWPTESRAAAARHVLADTAAADDDALLIEFAPEIERLGRERARHDALARRRIEIATRRDGLRAALRAHEAAFATLAPGCDLGAVLEHGGVPSAADVDEALALARRHGEHSAVLAERQTDHERAAAEHARLEAALAAAQPADDGAPRRARPPSELALARAELQALRSWVTERDRGEALLAEEERAERLAHIAAGRGGVGTPVLVALVLGIVLLGAVAVLALVDKARVAGAGAALGAVLLVGVAVALARARRTSTPERVASEPAGLVRSRQEVARRAAACGLPADAVTADLDGFAEELRREEEQRRALDQATAALADAAVQCATAAERLDAVRAQLAECEAQARALAKRCALAELPAPGQLGDVLRQLSTAGRDAADLARLETELAEIDDARASDELAATVLVDKLAALAAGAGDGTDLDAALGALAARAAAALQRAGERDHARTALAEAEEHLAAAFGTGDAADRLRAELASGAVLAWQDERLELAAALTDAEERYESLVTGRADADAALRALLGSDEIAALELERAGVAAELRATVAEWATYGLARGLLERTLARYERERQPLVIRRAGTLFATVTDGRYSELLAHEDPDGGRSHGLVAVTPDGRRVDAARLSRGTREQLYLCLRLALAATFAERAARLPLVLDDVLVNFDPGRAAAVARALADTAAEHQILAFTCHPHVVDLLSDAAPAARVVRLERRA